jgi:hypothetical protein
MRLCMCVCIQRPVAWCDSSSLGNGDLSLLWGFLFFFARENNIGVGGVRRAISGLDLGGSLGYRKYRRRDGEF